MIDINREPPDENDGGMGGKKRPHSDRTDSGLTEVKEAQMLRRAVEKGWLGGQRWPTRQTRDALQEHIETNGGSLVDKATLSAHDMLEMGPRAAGIAIGAIARMEAQNQRDEEIDRGIGTQPAAVIEILVSTPGEARQIIDANEYLKRIGMNEPEPEKDSDKSNGNGNH